MLTFIIPVRHPGNTRNWAVLKRILGQTAASIANQDSSEWRGVVVANTGADLPTLPPGFTVAWVDYPPNPTHDLGPDRAMWEHRMEQFRYDKGNRVLAGLLHAPDSDHYMVVDDDDFVSRRLAGFVARHPGQSGWYVSNGYVWSQGSAWLFRHPALHKICGTTHIIHRELMMIPPSSTADAARRHTRWLGTNALIAESFVAKGTPLQPLPFPGAVYRMNHGNSHSRTVSVRHWFYLRKGMLRRPHVLIGNLLRLALLRQSQIDEFGMAAAGAAAA